jgi:hypothetical protein
MAGILTGEPGTTGHGARHHDREQGATSQWH